MDSSTNKSQLYVEQSKAKNFFSKELAPSDKVWKKIHLCVQTVRIRVFSWKNREFQQEKKEAYFCSKKHFSKKTREKSHK